MTIKRDDFVLIEIPFSGFYDSIHGDNIEKELNDVYAYELYHTFYDELDDNQALNVGDKVADYDCIKNKVFEKYAKNYVAWFASEYDIENIEFESLEMPKFYNYESDRIFAKVKFSEILKIAKDVNLNEFASFVSERLEPSSGFIPHYSNDLKDWGLIRSWDFNQLGLMLDFIHKYENELYATDLAVNII